MSQSSGSDQAFSDKGRACQGRPRLYRLLHAGFTFFTALLLAGASLYLFTSMYQPEKSVRVMAVAHDLHFSPLIGLAMMLFLSLLFAVLALVQIVRALALLLDLHWDE